MYNVLCAIEQWQHSNLSTPIIKKTKKTKHGDQYTARGQNWLEPKVRKFYDSLTFLKQTNENQLILGCNYLIRAICYQIQIQIGIFRAKKRTDLRKRRLTTMAF